MGDFHWKFRGYYRAFAYCVFGCDTARSLLLLLPAARRSLLAVGCSVRVGCELRAARALLLLIVGCAVINILLLLIFCACAARPQRRRRLCVCCQATAPRVLPGHSAAGGV